MKNEKVFSARVNSGLFSAMLAQGDVMATFCGHDHINDFWGEMYGIRLHYGRATGFNTYGKEGFLRGACVINSWSDWSMDELLRKSDLVGLIRTIHT